MPGETKVCCENYQCTYTGEINKKGKAFGFGTAISDTNPEIKFEGTFKNGWRHGVGKFSRCCEFAIENNMLI